MTMIEQNLDQTEADQRIAWVEKNLGYRNSQSGHWSVVKYPYSTRVMFRLYFNYPEDQVHYTLRWA